MSYNSQTELLQFADCQRVEQATTGRRVEAPSINTFKNTIRDAQESRGLGDVYKRQMSYNSQTELLQFTDSQ